MADVTGPISTLPGSLHSVPKGMECDYHPGRPATCRVQGETDSFGCEMEDLCDECRAGRLRYARERDTSGRCDWCKNEVERRFDRRSSDEGLYGPVYQVCRPCIDKSDARLAAELEEWRDRNGDWD
jgi:hypothetical protein